MTQALPTIPEDPVLTWTGPMTFAVLGARRTELFDLLEAPHVEILWLDVRAVSDIDRAGVGLFLGAHRRALALGRQLVLLDDAGPVTATLEALALLGELVVVQVPADPARLAAAADA